MECLKTAEHLDYNIFVIRIRWIFLGNFFLFSSVSFMAVNVYAAKNKIVYELHLQNESIKLIQLIDLHCHVSNTDNKLLLFFALVLTQTNFAMRIMIKWKFQLLI